MVLDENIGSVQRKVAELENDLADECITVKGFVKKTRSLVYDYLAPNVQSELSKADDQLSSNNISEELYLSTVRKLLMNFSTSESKQQEESNKQPVSVENGADDAAAAVNGVVSRDDDVASDDDRQPEDDDNRSRKRKSSQTTKEKTTKSKPSSKKENPNSIMSFFKPDKTRSVGASKEPSGPAPINGVAQSSKDVEVDTTAEESSSEPKKKKMNIDTEHDDEDVGVKSADDASLEVIEEKSSVSRSVASTRCGQCKQVLDDTELVMHPGDPEGAVEEFIALTDPRLSIYNDEDGNCDNFDDRPQHKITNFFVYDKNAHLCPFDSGLVEKNVELYFSGWLKPVYDEKPDIDGGVPGKKLGPINEWWTAGFDGGENALIGFSTAFADYIVMSPHELYEKHMDAVKEKIYMSKCVIEYLSEQSGGQYEDLLNKLQVTVPPSGCSYTEDSLLRHAQFIVDQVQSFDSAAADNEELLIVTPCMRSLIKLAGVTLGRRRAERRAVAATQRVKKDVMKGSKATVTSLVRNVFNIFFSEQIAAAEQGEAGGGSKKRRCMVCEVCQQADCGECKSCKNMKKFGGSGRLKQSCERRKCPNMAVKEADENDAESDDDGDGSEEKENILDMLHKKSPSKHKGKSVDNKTKAFKWVGDSIGSDTKKKNKYYSSILIEEVEYMIGECVSVVPNEASDPFNIGKIVYMFEDSHGKANLHVSWFARGTETVLGECANPSELFVVDECDNIAIGEVMGKVEVSLKAASDEWRMEGGAEDDLTHEQEDDGKHYFYQKHYDTTCERFEDPPRLTAPSDTGLDHCHTCVRIDEKEAYETPTPNNKCEGESSGKVCYESFKLRGAEYKVGDFCYLSPDAYTFKIKDVSAVPVTARTNKEREKRAKDDIRYPELYRKSTDYIKGSNDTCPPPFRVGYITQIFTRGQRSDDVLVKVKKMYRPQDTHKGFTGSYNSDLNALYWSDEEATVEVSQVVEKIKAVYAPNLDKTIEDFWKEGPNRFYFSQSYNADTREYEEPPREARMVGFTSKGKGKGKATAVVTEDSSCRSATTSVEPLRCLDVFSGCGGLSEGFHQAGVAVSKWAIEVFEPAAQAFRLNNPGCTVFTDDCNLLLQLVMDGEETNHVGQKLPQKGDVELLCGGPPCQGFSGMNRFNSREYSKFKNSLIASYLSYCEYYRPRFFLLENVRNFVSFKNSMVLKLSLRCLIRMGYQCTFGILQAGQYGVPQTRRRAFILAAAPGEQLPMFPEPTHTFAPRACSLSVVIDGKKCVSNIRYSTSAPYRTITVRDCMSDLPSVKNGARTEEISYGGEACTHFQKQIRGAPSHTQPVLRDHTCKNMAPLIVARFRHIPLSAGSDWRDLPNVEVKLSDGTWSKLLRYEHHDKKQGRSTGGRLRGVCTCATGAGVACDPSDRQFNTLVPWCLPHTGNRHNHWAGLYGRLDWDGYFSTTVTNPEPMGKQGRVLHPEQARVVSVRECARSQGFPDTYRFFGSVLDKHRQVGNAVPPPLAAAIGREVRKCLVWRGGQGGQA